MRGQTEASKKDMSTKINEIVQQKARQSVGMLKSRSPLPPPLQTLDRGFAFRGSDEAKRNIMWVNNAYQNQNYFNDSVSSVQNKAKHLSRIKAAQARFTSNSTQNGQRQKGGESNSNNASNQDSWNFFMSQSRNSSQNRQEQQQPQTGQFFSSQTAQKSKQRKYGLKRREDELQYFNGYNYDQNQSNERNVRRNDGETSSWEETTEENRQSQLLEQIQIQQGRISQLEELLKRETLNSEEQRSQVRYLKTELLKSVSASGLVDLFEEAYIVSLDKQVDIIVQLKAIQQKIEEDVSESNSILHDQDENVKQLMEQNEIMQIQMNQQQSIHKQLRGQFENAIEEKTQLEEGNQKLLEEIEKIVEKNQDLAAENERFMKENERINRESQLRNRLSEERAKKIQQLETLIKDINEGKNDQDKAFEENQDIMIRLEEELENMRLENIELTRQNEDQMLVAKEYERQVKSKDQEIGDLKQKNNIQKEEIDILKGQYANQMKQAEGLQEQIESQKSKLESQIRQINTQVERIKTLEKENNALKSQEKSGGNNSKQGEKSQIDELETQVDSVKRKLEEQIQINEQLTTQMKESKVSLEEKKKQCANLEEEKKRIVKEVETLKEQHQVQLNINAELNELIERDQLASSQESNTGEVVNSLIQQNKELQAQVNDLQHSEIDVDQLRHRIEFMQQKSHFFSTQVIDMAKKLNLLDSQDDAVSQEEYESLVLEINSKIDALLENQQEKQNESSNAKEADNHQLIDLQLRLVDMVQEKYILETLVEQLKGFISNDEVFDVLDKYTEALSALLENEQDLKKVLEALQEFADMDEVDKESAEKEGYFENLEQARVESIVEHEKLIERRDYYHQLIEKLQEIEIGKKQEEEEYGEEQISPHQMQHNSQEQQENSREHEEDERYEDRQGIGQDDYEGEGEEEEQDDDGEGVDQNDYFHGEEEFEDAEDEQQQQQQQQNQYHHGHLRNNYLQ